jgi:hypothetical protein
MMGRFFLDQNGNYYEATTDIPTPPGHTPVAQRFPDPPSADDLRAGVEVTDIQFALAAVGLGIITAAEAEAWVARGELPAIALAAIGALPEELRPLARIRFSGARTISRLDPFVTGPLKAVAQMTDEQLDVFFAAAGDL